MRISPVDRGVAIDRGRSAVAQRLIYTTIGLVAMAAVNDAPIEVQRANFLATVFAVFGFCCLLLGGAGVLADSINFAFGYNVIIGLFWLVGAGYTHWKPEATDRGTEPAPRTWFEFAGVVASVMIVCVVFVLFGVAFL